MRWNTLGAAILLLALVPATYLAWNWRAMPHLGIYGDDSLYFVTARSLATDGSYRIESMPGAPAQTKYPPLYPLLLSLIWRLNPEFPSNLPLATLLCWLMLPLYVAAAWLLHGNWDMGSSRRVLLCGWMALSPVVAIFSVSMMSELLLCALLMLAIALADRARDWRVALVAGMVGAAAFLTRSAALPLLCTTPVLFLWRRQWRQAAAFAAAMAPAVVVWNIWKAAHSPTEGDLTTLYHTDYFAFYLANLDWSQLPFRAATNLSTMVSGAGQLVVFFEDHSIVNVTVGRLTVAAAVAGTVRLARRTGALHFPMYALVYVGLLIFWHYPPDARFLLPLLPLLLAGISEMFLHLASMARAGRNKPQASERIVAAAFAVVLGLFPIYAAWQTWHGLTGFVPRLLGAQRQVLATNLPAYHWIASHAPPNAQFFADDSALLYLHAGRRATNIALPTLPLYRRDVEAVTAYLAGFPAMAARHELDYALVTPSDFRLQEMQTVQKVWRRIAEDESLFQPQFRHGRVAVCRLEASGAD